MKKRINTVISIILLMTMLFTSVCVWADTTSADAEPVVTDAKVNGVEITEDGKQIIVINGVEHDVTGWSSEEIDKLKQTNMSGSHMDRGDMSLTWKLNPDYTIDRFIENGWSSEAAEKKILDASGAVVEQDSVYEGSLRLMIGLGVLEKINDKNAGDKPFTAEDFTRVMDIVGVQSAAAGLRPDYGDTIEGDELVEYLVNILGYYYFEEAPSLTARGAITKGVSVDYSREISREAASQLIRNTMSQEFLNIMVIDNYSPGGGSTIFENMNIIGITGWVSANFESNMFGGDFTRSQNYIQLNNKDFKIKDYQYNNYVGDYVDAFVLSKSGEEQVVISLYYNRKAEESCLEINPEDIDGVSNTQITYWSGDDEKTAKVTAGTTMVVNNENDGTLAATALDFRKVDSIMLYDLDNDRVYDYINIMNTDTYLVDQSQNGVIMINDYSTVLDYTNTEEAAVVYINGTKSTLDKITSDSVVSIAAKKKTDGVTIYASTLKDEGTIKTYSKDGITIEGDDTLYAECCDFSDTVNPGTYSKVYFDYQGKIAFVKSEIIGGPTITGRKYAYLRAAAPGEEAIGGEDTGRFRMWVLGQKEGEWKTFIVKGKLTLENGAALPDDGKTGHIPPVIRDGAGVIAQHPVLQTPQLVVIETDISGNLTKITTAQDVRTTGTIDENLFQYQAQVTGRTYGVGYFGGKFVYDSRSLGIAIPTDRSREDLYTYTTIEKTASSAHVYDAKADKYFAGIVITYVDSDAAASFNNPKTILVKETKTVLDEATGDKKFVLVAHNGDEYWSMDLDKNLGITSVVPSERARRSNVTKVSDIVAGDMLRIQFNSKNEITLFAVEVRCSDIVGNSQFFIVNANGDTQEDNFAGTVFMHGRVVLNGSAENSMLANVTGDGSDSTKNQPVVLHRNYTYYEYSRKTGTVSDIKPTAFMPGDYFVQYNSFWYIGNINVRIVD